MRLIFVLEAPCATLEHYEAEHKVKYEIANFMFSNVAAFTLPSRRINPCFYDRNNGLPKNFCRLHNLME